MARANYLIGNGERLVEPLGPPARRDNKAHPYEVDEARARLAPQLASTIGNFTDEVEFAPDGVQVARFVLHPAYLAKSYHPVGMLRSLGLEVLGSKPGVVRPERHTGSNTPGEPYDTSTLYVAGSRRIFERLGRALTAPGAADRELEPIRRVEAIESVDVASKLKAGADGQTNRFELVLHKPSEELAPSNQAQFVTTASRLGVEVFPEDGFDLDELWFVPARGSLDAITELARYTTLRVARPMPRLVIEPVLREVGLVHVELPLPPASASDDGIRVAILDGGLPEGHPITPWIDRYRKADPSAEDVPEFTSHGLAVASAFLFGPLRDGRAATPPPARVSVFRVLDSSTSDEDQFELYNVLGHIEDVLLSRAFDYVNISLGPSLPIEDDEVHAWTSVIDRLLSDGETLVTVAAGNNGALDVVSGNARIQVPGDAVNVVTVGSTDRSTSDWRRANYSAIGPGRSPGRTKPDLVMFGGSTDQPFNVLAPDGSVRGTGGTSFASPYALRHGVSVRSLLGGDLSPLAIRALLLHTADAGSHGSTEVGWGRPPARAEDIVISEDGVARVIYQGELLPGKYVRARVPVPVGGIDGLVTMRATFCFASPTDPASPDVYTRSALEPIFRRDLTTFAAGAKTPRSDSFFSRPNFVGETERRSDFGSWEPVLRQEKRMKGATLQSPVFDIHYNAREDGAASGRKDAMKYALVISLDAPKHSNLHQDILDAYPDVLVALEPVIGLDVTV